MLRHGRVAAATGDPRWRDAAVRLWADLVARHSYCTGHVGGRWMGEAVGRPYELDDETSYAESCGAVAMALQWFPFRRHEWFDVMCCPPNLARAFAAVPTWVASVGGPVGAGRADGHGDGDGAATLRIELPISARVTDGAWDVEVESGWPWSGEVHVRVRRAPDGGRIAVRVPGEGFVEVDATGSVDLSIPVAGRWWRAVPEVAAARGRAFLRRGPVVYALDAGSVPDVDLRRVVVDTAAPVDDRDPRAVVVRARVDTSTAAASGPYAPVVGVPVGASVGVSRDVVLRPYHEWPDGTRALRIWMSAD